MSVNIRRSHRLRKNTVHIGQKNMMFFWSICLIFLRSRDKIHTNIGSRHIAFLSENIVDALVRVASRSYRSSPKLVPQEIHGLVAVPQGHVGDNLMHQT